MPQRQYKYYEFVMAAFVTVILCSNLIGASKVATVAGFSFGAGVLFFPVSYIFGDILTEVYGYAKSRRVVWAGFGAMIFASFMSWCVLSLPPAAGWPHQEAFETVFAATPRIVLGSIVAFFCGELCNSFVLAKMKIATQGKHMWMRMIGSTVAGQGVDSLIFYPIAFYGIWSNELLLTVMLSNYLVKVAWEALITPFTYLIVNALKKAEQEDFYDTHTDFNPFSLKG
jgi:queuosine precursor transporter